MQLLQTPRLQDTGLAINPAEPNERRHGKKRLPISHRFINYRPLSDRKKHRKSSSLELLVQQAASLVLIINTENPAQRTWTRASCSWGQAAEQATQSHTLLHISLQVVKCRSTNNRDQFCFKMKSSSPLWWLWDLRFADTVGKQFLRIQRAKHVLDTLNSVWN